MYILRLHAHARFLSNCPAVYAVVGSDNGYFLTIGKDGKVVGTKDMQTWQIDFSDGTMQFFNEASGKYVGAEKPSFSGGGDVHCKSGFIGIDERWQLCPSVQGTCISIAST